jgi:hypothetical protein
VSDTSPPNPPVPGLDTFSPRRLVELLQKLRGLEVELESWRSRSENSQAFEKHNSQVRRAQNRLEPLLGEIRDILKKGGAEVAIVAEAQRVERLILAVHRTWEFFRGKFAQRQEEQFAPFLAAADEFAWACYEWARALAYPDPANSSMREPPLVFFNGGWSPFAVARGQEYRGEEVANEPLSGPRLKGILRSLPIPVIGVPWYQRQHLPDALFLGHEVGHLVEEDFGLTGVIEEAVKVTAVKRQPAWKSWVKEVFADVYGCLASGPAFVSTLMDFLAGAPGEVTTETRVDPLWGDYPTNYLRVLINLEVLKQMGFSTEAQSRLESWRGTYQSHALAAFEEDVPAVVKGLLAGPYPTLQGKSLRQVLDFTSRMQTDAEKAARSVQEGSEVRTREIRPLFAATRLLYDTDPAKFAEAVPALFTHITASLAPGTRAGETLLPESKVAEQASGDHALGAKLLAVLLEGIDAQPKSTSRIGAGT